MTLRNNISNIISQMKFKKEIIYTDFISISYGTSKISQRIGKICFIFDIDCYGYKIKNVRIIK